jgi:hypothetical protein
MIIQLDSVQCPSIFFPALIITLDNNTTAMLPPAINLAVVAVNELPGLDEKSLIFRSKPMVKVLESHNWAMAAISDTF